MLYLNWSQQSYRDIDLILDHLDGIGWRPKYLVSIFTVYPFSYRFALFDFFAMLVSIAQVM